MPTVEPAPLFHGKPVFVDFHDTVENPRLVLAAVHGLVRQLESAHASEDALVLQIHALITEFDGLTARLVGRTPEAIEFEVAKHQAERGS